MWKVSRRGRRKDLWNRPEHAARYQELQRFFSQRYPDLHAQYTDGFARAALAYEVAHTPQREESLDASPSSSIISSST